MKVETAVEVLKEAIKRLKILNKNPGAYGIGFAAEAIETALKALKVMEWVDIIKKRPGLGSDAYKIIIEILAKFNEEDT